MDKAIAIVGMSCRFAGCPTPSAYWNVIRERRVMLTAPGPEAELPIGQKNVFNRPYPTHLGQLGDLYACVPSMQNFPRQVNAGENQDLYFATQLAFDALADASIKPHGPGPMRGSVRVGYAPPFNASTVNWLQHTSFLDQTMDILRRFFPHAPEEALDRVKCQLVESLPSPNAASFLMGAGYRFASWIARECHFSGEATIMDGGMLSGAVTIETAMDDLNSGRVDVALAGALNPPLSRAYIEGLSGEVGFSTMAELHPFAQEQHGTIPGEGGAFFVLKRRQDALRDRDRIYALICSTAIGHNPEDDPSYIFAEAAARAEVPVRTIGLIEADGSGIAVQEAREIAVVQRLWGDHKPGGPLVGVGSVKGNVGHTLRASMSAGMVKAALALWHKVLPPQIAPGHPADAISNLGSSAYLLADARPWITGDSSSPRRAAVMGANFDSVGPSGGSCEGRSAVIILEEEPEDRA
ncbi:MAG: polyketide synthase [Kiritimatiellae bacterium]|nr:polyketide synthase [Kiritimatiellia bacterium]